MLHYPSFPIALYASVPILILCRQWIMASFAACPASYYWVKLSVLLFYLRVFPPYRRTRYTIYALIAYCTFYYWLAFGAVVGLCNAKNRDWDINSTMNCFAHGPLLIAIGAMDLVSDFLVLAFPVPFLIKLQLSWPQKIYLLVVFGAGLV